MRRLFRNHHRDYGFASNANVQERIKIAKIDKSMSSINLKKTQCLFKTMTLSHEEELHTPRKKIIACLHHIQQLDTSELANHLINRLYKSD